MSRYAVVGNPIAHSKSPQIHRLFAEQTGEDVEYSAIKLEEKEFDSFIAEFFAAGGAGLNVTVPFKERAYALTEKPSPRAAVARAVNTLYQDQDGRLAGDNTDGPGLVRDIQENHGFSIRGRRVLMLGAGGAVRGTLAPVIEQEPGSITLVNRTPARAEALQQDFEKLMALELSDYAGLAGRQFDLVINGTSLGLSGQAPPLPNDILAPGCCCYDMMYGAGATPFQSWAQGQGAALALDGLGMLVEQAAEAFLIWRGVRPDTAPVIAALRS